VRIEDSNGAPGRERALPVDTRLLRGGQVEDDVDARAGAVAQEEGRAHDTRVLLDLAEERPVTPEARLKRDVALVERTLVRKVFPVGEMALSMEKV
jgi:hypothetical protein